MDAAWELSDDGKRDSKDENVRLRFAVTEGMWSFSGEGEFIGVCDSKC